MFSQGCIVTQRRQQIPLANATWSPLNPLHSYTWLPITLSVLLWQQMSKRLMESQVTSSAFGCVLRWRCTVGIGLKLGVSSAWDWAGWHLGGQKLRLSESRRPWRGQASAKDILRWHPKRPAAQVLCELDRLVRKCVQLAPSSQNDEVFWVLKWVNPQIPCCLVNVTRLWFKLKTLKMIKRKTPQNSINTTGHSGIFGMFWFPPAASFLTLKSIPTVAIKLPPRNAPSLKRTKTHVFPTAESPSSIT